VFLEGTELIRGGSTQKLVMGPACGSEEERIVPEPTILDVDKLGFGVTSMFRILFQD
jgi:hypothetical protein